MKEEDVDEKEEEKGEEEDQLITEKICAKASFS